MNQWPLTHAVEPNFLTSALAPRTGEGTKFLQVLLDQLESTRIVSSTRGIFRSSSTKNHQGTGVGRLRNTRHLPQQRQHEASGSRLEQWQLVKVPTKH